MKHLRIASLALLLGLIHPLSVHAACSNNEDGVPGAVGEIEYFSTNELKYCDGTNWVLMAEPCGGTGTACGGDPDQRIVFLAPSGAKDHRAGGLLGLDSSCTRTAWLAGMHGIFYVWATDKDPNNAPANRFEHSAVPYVKYASGTGTIKVADDWADLIDCTGSCLDAPIDREADGTLVNSGITAVVTNTNTDGTQYSSAVNDSCDGWTLLTGAPHRGNSQNTGASWTDSGTSGVCNNSIRAYCFEQQGSNRAAIINHAIVSQTPETEDVRELTAWGDYAYVLSNTQKSVSSIDISDPTNSLSVSDTYIDATNLLTPRGIVSDGNYLYIASTGADSLQIIDISDPTNLVTPSGGNNGLLVDSTNLNGAYGVDIQGNYAYVAAGAAKKLVVVDVSDPANPTIAGGGSGMISFSSNAQKVAVSGNYAYVTFGYSSNTLAVVDISDPTSPSLAGTLTDNTNMVSPFYVHVQGNYAYITATGSNAFVVVDVSTPSAPAIANSGNAKIINDYYLGSVSGLQVDGNFAYFSTLNHGSDIVNVGIIDISDPLNPFITAASKHNGVFIKELPSIAKSGRFLFAADKGNDKIIAYETITNYAMGETCSKAGEIFYDSASEKMVWCNGTSVIPMDFTGGGTGTCTSPTAIAGALNYDSASATYRFCDGSGWVDIGK